MRQTRSDTTIRTAVDSARTRLATAPFEPSSREAALLMAHVLGADEVAVLTRRDEPLAPDLERRYRELVERRLAGEPFAYLTGMKEFFGRPFRVDSRVLVPRPETEHLIEAVLELDLPPRPRILDVGTGSGAIALTLALEIGDARILATDISPAALAVARRNRQDLGLETRVDLIEGDLVAGVDVGGIDLVVCNPPYVAPAEAPMLSIEILDFEPAVALFDSGDSGLETIRRLLGELRDLPAGARVVLEIGAGQADETAGSAAGHGFRTLGTIEDYSRIPRILVLERT